MKRLFFSLVAIISATTLFAGGIVTNTNQSAAFVRMPAQDAATGIQAVYHNPAALTKLADGFHIQLNNQSIFQTKEIESTFPFLNEGTYVGDVKAPLFPSFYAAFKTGKLAFSLGFNPVGGGGGAEYKTGLPSFEQPVASIPDDLAANHIPTTAYSADVFFEGTSIFWGLQAGLSFEINENVSVYAGVRYLMAKNTYKGHIKDIMINPNYPSIGYSATMVPATDFFSDLSTALAAGATQLSSTATSMNPFVTGYGSQTFDNAIAAADPTNAAYLTAFKNGLINQGIPNAGDSTVAVGQETYNALADSYTQKSTDAAANSQATKDIEVDSEQTGNAISPILGAHFTLMDDKLNIGMKYEFKAPLEITNSTVVDGSGMFPDGEVVPSEMPSLLSVGVDYKILDNFSIAVGYHQYFDKTAKFGKQNDAGEYITNETLMDANSMELAVGLQYGVSENFMLSGGWLYTSSGVTVAYQSDLSYSLNTNSMAFGARAQVSPAFAIDLGVMYTFYQDGEKGFTIPMSYKEIYRKSTFTAGIGFSYTLGASAE